MGPSPTATSVELAFLDAYDAGILVAASAGNSGPGAGTTDHHGPWVLTVAASTQSRQFQSTLTVTDGADHGHLRRHLAHRRRDHPDPDRAGPGHPRLRRSTARPSSPPGVGHRQDRRLPARRRIGRIQKGVNVAAGGAAGMILYNLPLADTESDNHFLPAVHLADGTAFLAFMAAHPDGHRRRSPQGVKADGQGDVMAAFSSRGPGGQFLKPDITAPGVQILAGNTPTPDEVPGGPAGQYYQAIAGTSMSSPHVAGSAILLKALHPDWDSGRDQVGADDHGQDQRRQGGPHHAGRPVRHGCRSRRPHQGRQRRRSCSTSRPTNMFDLGTDPITALDINSPSINVPTMPGTVTVTRTATNVTNQAFGFNVSTTAPAGSTIKVTPGRGRIQPGASQTFQVTITSNAPTGQYFGQIDITSKTTSLHLPVAFFNQQGKVTLTQTCDPVHHPGPAATRPATSPRRTSPPATPGQRSTRRCPSGCGIVGATGATVSPDGTAATAGPVTLAAPEDATPAIAAGDTAGRGYLDLGRLRHRAAGHR